MEEGLAASRPYRIVRLRDAADRLVPTPWIEDRIRLTAARLQGETLSGEAICGLA
jgi:hypothetical protein